MKAISKIYLIGLVVTLAFSSCNYKGKYPPEKGSYIKAYFDIERGAIYEKGYYQDSSIWWKFVVLGTEYAAGDEKYRELSILYGDTAFYENMLPEDNPYKNIYRSDSLPSFIESDYCARMLTPFVASASPLKAVELITMEDYDEDHPKGSSLNDMATLFYVNCWDYIQSGYKIELYPFWNPYKFVRLSEFPEEPIKLMHWYAHYILLDKQPTIPTITGNHKIELYYHCEDGKKMRLLLETNSPLY